MRRALPDELLSRLSAWVAAETGLYFPQERWRDLEGGIAAAARDFGQPDAESCARWLLSTVPARSHVEILASHLTVGETYFFREPRSLEVFEEQILPELLRSRQDDGRHLRIWSAACCTGEEPYSIAMILDRVIPDPKTCPVTILATDINPQFLRKAAEGVYGEWSFRGTPGWVRERYFRTKGGARFELLPQIRNRVTFSCLNLARDIYPSLLNNTNAMDVIFCRNVLMYFSAERAREVIRNLYRSLVDGGWLIVSPAETSGALFSLFSAVQFPGVLVYRKVAGIPSGVVIGRGQSPVVLPAADAMNPLVTIPGAVDVAQGGWRAGSQGEVPPEPGVPEAPEGSTTPAQRTDDRPAFAGAARNCANEGRLAEAVEWCDKSIAADKLNPAHYYLLGTIQQEQGHAEAAQRSLKRALYLDPGFVLAHFALGNGELLQGRPREAERHFRNALTMLQRHPQDGVVPESEGLTAEGLTGIVMSVLSSLPAAEART